MLSACAETRYVKLDGGENKVSPYRIVKVDVSEDLRRSYPDCTTVMPISGKYRGSRGTELIGLSLARHLHQKLTRVIGPIERKIVRRKLAADLRVKRDMIDVLKALTAKLL